MMTSLSPLTRRSLVALPLFAALIVAFAANAPAADSAPAPDQAPSSDSARQSLEIARWIPPEERSDRPKPEEWEKATPLELARPHATCSASALREWLRISCLDPKEHVMGVRPLGGSEEGVHIADFKEKVDEKRSVNGVHIMMPVRRGDRRLLGLSRWESGGYRSFNITEDTELVISELWLPDDQGPTIVVH